VGWTLCINGLAVISQRSKFCDSMFNEVCMGIGYVSKLWLFGYPAPLSGGGVDS